MPRAELEPDDVLCMKLELVSILDLTISRSLKKVKQQIIIYLQMVTYMMKEWNRVPHKRK